MIETTMTRMITALEPQKRNPDRVNVYLDGEFAFGLARRVAEDLRIGATLSPAQVEELNAADAVEVAMLRAWNLLSYRARTEQELRDRLAKYGFDQPVIDDVLNRMQQNGYVDDDDFAARWVENRSEFRPRGARLLRLELRQKGVDSNKIDQAVDGLDEAALAERAARKRARRYKDLDWEEFRKKMLGFLSRRGFNYDHIRAAIQHVWDEQREAAHTTEEY